MTEAFHPTLIEIGGTSVWTQEARRATGNKEPAAVCDRFGRCEGPEGYFADFSAVRRQRVQTIAFTVVPFLVIGYGWRFGW